MAISKVRMSVNFKRADGSYLFTNAVGGQVDIAKERDTKAECEAAIAAEIEAKRAAAQGNADELTAAASVFPV